MLEHLRGSGKASDRKLRLFACACARRVWRLLTAQRLRRLLELAERYADEETTWDDIADRWKAVVHLPWNNKPSSTLTSRDDAYAAVSWAACPYSAETAASKGAACASYSFRDVKKSRKEQGAAERAEKRVQAALLRDIFGPLPFRDVQIAHPC
jgi:hypothetical protein